MTCAKLIERMRTDTIFDNTTLGNEAADAIEALQKEVSTLDVLLEECKMDWSGDVTQLKAEHKHEIEALQSKLGDAIQSSAHWQHQCTELQSRLDGMGKGEPVGFVAPHELKDLSEGFPATVVMFRSNKRTVPLYAAPKALAPLTDDHLETLVDIAYRHWQNQRIFNIAAVRADFRAHGIGGTPT